MVDKTVVGVLNGNKVTFEIRRSFYCDTNKVLDFAIEISKNLDERENIWKRFMGKINFK